jgi:hypothetical protein
MSRSYTSSPPSASMACSETALYSSQNFGHKRCQVASMFSLPLQRETKFNAHIKQVIRNANVKFEYFLTVKLVMLFWVVTPCKLISRYQRFGDAYYLHFQGRGGDAGNR